MCEEMENRKNKCRKIRKSKGKVAAHTSQHVARTEHYIICSQKCQLRGPACLPVSCRRGSELSYGHHKVGDTTENCHPGCKLPTAVPPATKTWIQPQT